MNIKDNSIKTTESSYQLKAVEPSYSWMHEVKYWFRCDKPEKPLEFLGVKSHYDQNKPYNMCYFKEVDDDNYYKCRMDYCAEGWDGSYEGSWAWVSNKQPYPNSPRWIRWELRRKEDIAYEITGEQYEHAYYYECERPEGELTKIGKWHLKYGDFKGDMYSDSETTVTYYNDGNNIYRLVSGPFRGQEQWYITTGREWPGTDGMEYPECRTIVKGLIETGKVTLVTGVQCCGKSHLIAQLCSCVTNGIPFLGMDTVPCDTVHLNYHMSEDGLGVVYGDINNFYGKEKVASTYVATGEPPLSKDVSIGDILENIEFICETKKLVRLIAIDSVDLFGFRDDMETQYFIRRLKEIATKYRVAIVYACSAKWYESDAVSLAETCDFTGFNAELPYLLMGIIPDQDDNETFTVHLKNDFDVDKRIICRKNGDTHYCFEVEDVMD